MGAYLQGTVTVGTTATLLLSVPVDASGVLIQNNGSAAVILGGSTVTATGATAGISLAAGATVLVPVADPVTTTEAVVQHDLYATVATGTQPVAYLVSSAS